MDDEEKWESEGGAVATKPATVPWGHFVTIGWPCGIQNCIGDLCVKEPKEENNE